MKNIYIANTAVFLSVAVLHGMRLVFYTPATIGDVQVTMWLSAIALVVTAALAMMNWCAVGNHTNTDILRLLLALIVVDVFVLFYSWASSISYWGITHDTFLWFILMDLVLFAIIHTAVRKTAK